MRHTFFIGIALLMASPSFVHATAQIPDSIILDGEVSALHSEPLTALIWRSPGDGGIVLERPIGSCSASWRGYAASWRIQDDKLILEKIKVDPCSEEPREVPLASLFPKQAKPIVASWFTGILIIPRGKMAKYVHMGYMSTYERYVVLVLKKGRIVSRVDLDEPPQ